MQKKILIISPHPDDEVLGCGGVIAKYSLKKDYGFYTLILTAGAKTRYPKKMEKILRENAEKANGILGVEKVFFEDLPNQQLDAIPITKVIKTIEKYTEKIKPEIVFTSAPSDLNKDHQIVYHASVTAARPIPGQFIKKVFTYFTASSTEWQVNPKVEFFVPNTYIDIKDTIDKKIEAMKCYESECRKYPHPRSPEALKKYAAYFGISSGIRYAEPFMLIRDISGQIF